MISTHFSSTSRAANFINKLNENDHKNAIIHIAQRHLLTRIISVSLSIFALIDCVVHTAGILESGVKAVILYASGKVAANEWKNMFKHFGSIGIFIAYIPISLSVGATCGGSALLSKFFTLMENESVKCVNTMLLSERPEYSKDCVVVDLPIVEYIEKYSIKMPQNECAGMERTLPLLINVKKYLKQEQFYKTKKNVSVNTHLTHKLCNQIGRLRSRNQYDSIIDRIFFKEILTRLISIGICVTSLIDTVAQILSIMTTIQFTIIVKLIFHSSAFFPELNTLSKLMLSEIRDLFIKFFGTITGPVIGLISPEYAKQIADPESRFFDPIRFSGENPTKAILNDLDSLPVDQSILIPLTFRADRHSGHIVYCLIENTAEGYHFSTLNTGYGSNLAALRLKFITYIINNLEPPANWTETDSPKEVANYTFRKISKDELTAHIRSIQELAQKSFEDIQKEAMNNRSPQTEGLTEESMRCKYILDILYPAKIGRTIPEIGGINSKGNADLAMNPNLIFCKPQSVGDCPKSSLLAALNYHSSHCTNEINYQAYDKWIRHLRGHVFDEDGHLIDLSLTINNFDRGAHQAAREELDKSWASYHSKYS